MYKWTEVVVVTPFKDVFKIASLAERVVARMICEERLTVAPKGRKVEFVRGRDISIGLSPERQVWLDFHLGGDLQIVMIDFDGKDHTRQAAGDAILLRSESALTGFRIGERLFEAFSLIGSPFMRRWVQDGERKTLTSSRPRMTLARAIECGYVGLDEVDSWIEMFKSDVFEDDRSLEAFLGRDWQMVKQGNSLGALREQLTHI